MKDSILIKAIDVLSTDEQETLSVREKREDKYIRVKFEDFKKQIDDSIAPLIASINGSKMNKKKSGNISKVTVKLGFSLKGDIILVSGQVDGAIELEFTNF